MGSTAIPTHGEPTWRHKCAPEASLRLQKALYIVGPSLDKIHSYPMDWYDTPIMNPLGSILGFQRSFEYRQFASLPDSVFPPAETDFPFGVAYHQAPFASDPLILAPLVLPVIFQTFGVLRDVV